MAGIDFKARIFDHIADKMFRSNISGEVVDVVRQLPEQIEEGKVLFDGLLLYDGIEGIEDDIQQMTAVTKDCIEINLEDYYTANGAFNEDGEKRFIEALDNLMTREEYAKASKATIRKATEKYIKQRNEEIKKEVDELLSDSYEQNQ